MTPWYVAGVVGYLVVAGIVVGIGRALDTNDDLTIVAGAFWPLTLVVVASVGVGFLVEVVVVRPTSNATERLLTARKEPRRPQRGEMSIAGRKEEP
jgi:hypothetical protein